MAFISVIENPNFNLDIWAEKGDAYSALLAGRQANDIQYSKHITDKDKIVQPIYGQEDIVERKVPALAGYTTLIYKEYYYHPNYNPYLHYYFEVDIFANWGAPGSYAFAKLLWRGATQLVLASIEVSDATVYKWQGSIYIPSVDAYAGGLPVSVEMQLNNAGIVDIRWKRLYLTSGNYVALPTIAKGTA